MSLNPKKVTVDFSTNPPTCNPDPVTVKKQDHKNGIKWKAKQTDYTFTGVEIDGHDAPWGDFGTPSFGSDDNKSWMTVTDNVVDDNEYTYSLKYTDPQGNPGTYDPRIKNEQ